MSRRGNFWDKTVVESFFSSLKKERIKKRIYKTRAMARADVFDYIEALYNRMRRHSHLGGVSPKVFEEASMSGSAVSINAGALQLGNIGAGLRTLEAKKRIENSRLPLLMPKGTMKRFREMRLHVYE